MSDELQNVTAVIIHYQTPDLTERTLRTLRQHYPHLSLLLIDNGSKDGSLQMLKEDQSRYSSSTRLIANERNMYHGPAMHQALQHLSTEFVHFIDSDCNIVHGQFIEKMVRLMENSPRCYAVGKLVYMNNRGFDVPRSEKAIPYIRPVCMLLRRSLYFELPPFTHHGTPCLDNMQAAGRAALLLIDFPVFDYVTHEERGTSGRYGYGLGLKGKLNYLLNKLGL